MAPPVTVYMSGCSPLHHFRLIDMLFGGEVPDSRGVFKYRSDIGLVTVNALTGLGQLLVLRLRKVRVLFAFLVIASTW